MHMNKFEMECNFYGIGQGLFSAGKITVEMPMDNKPASLVWVYDCGSRSHSKSSTCPDMSRSIAEFEHNFYRGPKQDSVPVIDLLAISHFDSDHISGVVDLLAKFKVKRILLPHMALWKRLVYFTSSGMAASSSYYSFILDPVKYINGVAKHGTPNITIVFPSDYKIGGDEDGNQDPNQPPVLDDDGNFFLDVDEGNNIPPQIGKNSVDYGQINSWRTAGYRVGFLNRGGLLRVKNLWEFVPYNDQYKWSKATRAFRVIIENLCSQLLNSSGSATASILSAIKQEYDKTFGAGSYARNVISLFLYGRMLPSRRACSSYHFRGIYVRLPSSWSQIRKCKLGEISVFYTGDGYVNTPRRWSKIVSVLGLERTSNINVFQVMHHGSRGNWYSGLAATIDPAVSVFSADPKGGGYGHPHADVVKDFIHHFPVLAERGKDVKISARCLWQ